MAVGAGVGAVGYAAYAAMAAAAVYSVYSSVQAGKQANLNADAQAEQAENDAATEKSAAMVQADRIRKMARIQNSQATAALAASGVSVNEGTALNINQEITRNAEEDAALTIFGGGSKAQRMNNDASNYRLSGKQAQDSYNGQAVGTVLSTGSSMYSGWKGSANGTASRQGGV